MSEISPTEGKIRVVRRLNVRASKRDAQALERQLASAIISGTFRRKEEKKVPKLNDFASEFIKHYVEVHNKPSEQRNKEIHLRLHLKPNF